MNEKIKQFRVLYEKLSHLLAEKTGLRKEANFYEKVEEFLRANASYRKLKDDLQLIHEARNTLVHEERKKELLVPTDWFIKRVEAIVDQLENPQTALDIATPREKVVSCQVSDKISAVVQKMRNRNFTHVPVYDPDERVIGVLSENSLLRWLARSATKGGFLLEGGRIKDIMGILEVAGNDYWDFAPRDLSACRVKEMFYKFTGADETGEKEPKRLGVLFVTQNGREDEKVLGLITAWDLLKIEELELID